MIVVAVCALATSVEVETAFFARESGLAPYDARMKLSQPAPAIVLRTADRDAARTMLVALRARGHDAVACDEDMLVAPTTVRALRFGGDAFEHDGASTPYADVLALIRAVRATRTETTERVTERKLRPGAALVTGGLILSKKVTRDEKHVAHDKEDLLYVFAHTGAPIVVSERGTSYASLGDIAKSQRENFLRVASDLRARATAATYDERLLALRVVVDPREIDLRAHLLAIAIARSPPWR